MSTIAQPVRDPGEQKTSLAAYRIAFVLLLLLPDTSLHAQSVATGQYGTPTRTYAHEDFDRIPSTLHLWSLLAHTEVSATSQRFDISGMHSDEAMLFSARGGAWSQNSVLWNGFHVTSGDGKRTLLAPDLSAVESMTYEAGSASASGTVLSLEPRRGESSLHGQAQILFQSGALQNVNVTPRLQSFGITESDERFRYFARGNIQLGGPLSSGWTYFGSVSRLQMEKRIRNYSLPVNSTLTSETVHLSGDLNPRNRFGLDWLAQQASQPEEGATPQVAIESTRHTSRTFQSLQASWTQNVSPRSVFDGRAALSIGRTDAALQPDVNRPASEELFPGSVDIPLVPSAEAGKSIVALLNHVRTGTAPEAIATRDRRLQATTQFHTSRNGPGTSRHRLSFETNVEWVQEEDRTHAFQDMNLRFFRGVPNSVQLLNPSHAQNSSTQVEGLAVDTIHFGAFTFSLSSQASWTWGSNRRTLGPEGSTLHWESLGAHAGIAYQIGHRYPTVLQAAVAHRPQGTQEAQEAQEALMRALEAVHPNGPGVSTYSWNDTNQDKSFQPGELGILTKVEGSPFTRLDPNLKQPYSRNIYVGATQELPGKFRLSLHAFRRVEHRVLALVNTGVPSSAYDAVPVFDPGNDGASQTGDEAWLLAYNQRTETLGLDAYRVTNATDSNAFSEGYEARLTNSRTWLHWELAVTQYRAVARTAPGNGPLQNDFAVLAVINDPNQSVNAYGSTFFDRGLGARFLGTWQPARNLSFSWITSYLDGSPYGRILPVAGLNQGLIGILATRRGPGDGSAGDGKRTAYNLTTDLRLARGFHLGHGRLDATLDIFNVFNIAHALSEADVTSPNHLWRIPVRFQTPRSLQLGLRSSW